MKNQKNLNEQNERKRQLKIQIGKRCQQARKARGYTQEQLAEQLNVSTQFISDAERGVTGMSIYTIRELCNILATTPDFILLYTDNDSCGKVCPSLTSHIQNLSPQENRGILEDIIRMLLDALTPNNRL